MGECRSCGQAMRRWPNASGSLGGFAHGVRCDVTVTAEYVAELHDEPFADHWLEKSLG